MGIVGTHLLLYTSEPEALRAVMRDVFGWPHVDAGEGWLIFAAPPAEIGVHPADEPGGAGARHQISFMCDDIHKTVDELRSRGRGLGHPRHAGAARRRPRDALRAPSSHRD